MPNQRVTDKNEMGVERTLIGASTKLKGQIESSHNVYLEGESEGSFYLNSLFFIGKNGKFKGMVEARDIIVEGRLDGEIMARGKIELRQSGFIKGNVICQNIAIAEGSYFEGEVVMESGATVIPLYFTEKRKALQGTGDPQ